MQQAEESWIDLYVNKWKWRGIHSDQAASDNDTTRKSDAPFSHVSFYIAWRPAVGLWAVEQIFESIFVPFKFFNGGP